MFGKHLKAFRKKSGLSQQELADKLHISRSTVSKIENDNLEVSTRLFRDWAVVTQNEFNAACVMFGSDVFANLTTVTQVINMIWRF